MLFFSFQIPSLFSNQNAELRMSNNLVNKMAQRGYDMLEKSSWGVSSFCPSIWRKIYDQSSIVVGYDKKKQSSLA